MVFLVSLAQLDVMDFLVYVVFPGHLDHKGIRVRMESKEKLDSLEVRATRGAKETWDR